MSNAMNVIQPQHKQPLNGILTFSEVKTQIVAISDK